MIVLFKTTTCPKCNRLKIFLETLDVKFDIFNMDEPKGMAELYTAGVYATEAPVLLIDGVYLLSSELFIGNEINESKIRQLIGKL